MSSIEVNPINFPPEVLARISPDISLQRHLSLGLRPSLRKYEEFRDYHVSSIKNDNNEFEGPILGGNISKIGNMFVITTITGGIVEELVPVDNNYDMEEESSSSESTKIIPGVAAVWPVVEVERGRVGAPTDEEMIVSQKIYENVLSSGIISNESLKVDVGVCYQDGRISYNDISMKPKNRRWSYVLYSKQQVFSRSGPIFELLWNSLMLALKSVKLPRVYIDERATDLKIPIRTRGRSATIRETYDLLFDQSSFIDLKINEKNVGFASNFGVIDLDPSLAIADEETEEDKTMAAEHKESVLLADLEDETEEGSILSKISIITTPEGEYKNVYFASADSRVSLDQLKRSLKLSVSRAKDLSIL